MLTIEGTRGLLLAGATDGYDFAHTGSKHQAFLVACSVQQHCRSSKWTLSTGFPIKPLYVFLFSPIPVTCPTHHLFLDFIARLINEILNYNINVMFLNQYVALGKKDRISISTVTTAEPSIERSLPHIENKVTYIGKGKVTPKQAYVALRGPAG
jgi:hypothetical protein